ncbi:ABC transporter ATP-binding protein [Gephyromycinifex aptenodytis]|uniref:ABC transporter ATP-binding protein n=1 Tax=Gephyromycinifex aptenodytis TaxID=2716227 RepID=UPI001D024680|nr:ABC transporter ATP-binding protein [Gephyromycinifex aptenodytis]
MDLVLPRGYVMGFIGTNGAGKTTTIKAALGMLIPDSGVIQAPPMERIGVVLDSPFYVRDWRVRDVARAVAPFYPHWDQSKFESLCADFGLAQKPRVKELSRGQGMKLMTAVALAHDAELLILDEPTSGLDPLARDHFLDILAEFMQDESHAVLFSTHITSDLERIADLVTVIDSGRIVTSQATEDLLERFVLVRGGPDDLPGQLRHRVHGLREHSVGFDALVDADDAALFGPAVVRERPSLDDLVVRLAGHSVEVAA